MIRDIRYAVRTLSANKPLTAVAVLTLALGIGVNTAIFSLADAMVFRPLPVAENKSLVAVYNKEVNSPLGELDSISYPDYVDYRDTNRVFSGMLAYGILDAIAVGNADQPQLSDGEFVSGNYFDVLGVRPALGAAFHEKDDSPAASPVVVLSYWMWQRTFTGDPAIIGRKVALYNIPFTVVGVADKNFTGLMKGITPAFWVPLRQQEILYGADRNRLMDRRNTQLGVIGRLKPGVTIDQASANLNAVASGLGELYPDTNKDRKIALRRARDIILFPTADTAIRGSAAVLLALSGFVLLIACANLANLLLARGAARRREIAVRLAIGGSRRRVIRQLLTESTMLALGGGSAGLLLAAWCTGFLNTVELPIPIHVALGAQLDWRVLTFTFGLSLLTGVVFGVLPSIQTSRPDVVSALKDDPFSPPRGRSGVLRAGLVVGQIAVSLVLLAFAGLAVRSLRNTTSAHPGFNPQNMGVAVIDPSVARYDSDRSRGFARDALFRIRSLAGIRSAATTTNLPLALQMRFMGYSADGPENLPEKQWKYADGTMISDGYFRTMEIPFIEGRDFSESDERAAEQRVIVNQTMAKTLWPGRSAIGRRVFVSFNDKELAAAEVIGVVADGKYRTLGESPRPFVYGNLFRNFWGGNIVFRVEGDLPTAYSRIRAAIREIDPAVPILRLQSVTDRMGPVLLIPRYAALLFGALGFLGAALAVVGLYGVVSYTTSRRTREIGIRMALGGERRDVVKLVIRDGMILTSMGLAAGLALAAIASRFISSILYGVGPTDPLTFATISALMIAVSGIACYIPARRASQVDTIVALRHE